MCIAAAGGGRRQCQPRRPALLLLIDNLAPCRYHPGMDEVVLSLNKETGRVDMTFSEVGAAERCGDSAGGIGWGQLGRRRSLAASHLVPAGVHYIERLELAACPGRLCCSAHPQPVLLTTTHNALCPPSPTAGVAAQPGAQEAVHAGPAAGRCGGAQR